MRDTQDIEERFWSKVKIGTSGECWEWQRYKKEDGYGVFRVSRLKTSSSHRFAYRLTYGNIPKGKQVLHKCDNPACCNPSHLFIGTQQDNIQDMVRKGRNVSIGCKGATNGGAKLDDAKVKEILSRLANGETQKFIATSMGVKQATVARIKLNISWKHVPRESDIIFPVNRRKDYSANRRPRPRNTNGTYRRVGAKR